MFCLRSWLGILFLLSGRASPIYVVLFLTATYVLNRPCVYCSLLLAVLVVALFDFRGDWFETPGISSQQEVGSHSTNDTSVRDAVLQGASVLATGFNQTAAALVDTAAAQISQRSSRMSWTMYPIEWAKGVWDRGELRLDCINSVIRL